LDGADHWFTASEALRVGLVDEVIAPTSDAPAPPLAGYTPRPADPDHDAEQLLIELLHRLRGEFRDVAVFKAILRANLNLQLEGPSRQSQAAFAGG
jgi:enoyl-CoA hydratase/carnithine racemase